MQRHPPGSESWTPGYSLTRRRSSGLSASPGARGVCRQRSTTPRGDHVPLRPVRHADIESMCRRSRIPFARGPQFFSERSSNPLPVLRGSIQLLRHTIFQPTPDSVCPDPQGSGRDPQGCGNSPFVFNLLAFVVLVVVSDQSALSPREQFHAAIEDLQLPLPTLRRRCGRRRSRQFPPMSLRRHPAREGQDVWDHLLDFLRALLPDDAIHGLIGQVFGLRAVAVSKKCDQFAAKYLVFLPGLFPVGVQAGKKPVKRSLRQNELGFPAHPWPRLYIRYTDPGILFSRNLPLVCNDCRFSPLLG